jgi:hypothetical protein
MSEENGASIQDSVAENVAGGNINTGNVIHHHHYATHAAPPAETVTPPQLAYQQPAQQFPPQTQHPVQQTTPLFNLDDSGATAVVYVVWLFFGIFGGHRILLGDWGMGVLYFFTCGLFFIGWIGDFAKLPEMIENARQAQRQANHPSF